MIAIILNGENRTINSQQLNDLLLEITDIDTQCCAIALNHNFVPRSEYAKTTLQNGDELECLTPMQGG